MNELTEFVLTACAIVTAFAVCKLVDAVEGVACELKKSREGRR